MNEGILTQDGLWRITGKQLGRWLSAAGPPAGTSKLLIKTLVQISQFKENRQREMEGVIF